MMRTSENVLYSYWLNRFQVFDKSDGYYCRDWLRAAGKIVSKNNISELSSAQAIADLFRTCFVPVCESTIFKKVGDKQISHKDLLFWQYPCRTEAAAFDIHSKIVEPIFRGNEINCYVGLPWATWIDKIRIDSEQKEVKQQISWMATRFFGLRKVLASLGIKLRIHTVCQHIYWKKMVPYWQTLGVTDAWLSHLSVDDFVSSNYEIKLHSWHLYAVNVEDRQRNDGLTMGKDPLSKKYLASFIGVHMPHYLSDVRLRLRDFINLSDFYVDVTQERWHFEKIVYEHQICNGQFDEADAVDSIVVKYNEVMSDSIFALCPSGAGPNTIRFWEALAIGAIPVLLGKQPVLPMGNNNDSLNWDEIVIRVPDDCLSNLPTLLRSVPQDERRKRQEMCLRAYSIIKEKRCFEW